MPRRERRRARAGEEEGGGADGGDGRACRSGGGELASMPEDEFVEGIVISSPSSPRKLGSVGVVIDEDQQNQDPAHRPPAHGGGNGGGGGGGGGGGEMQKEGTGRRRRAAAHAENGGHRETADLAKIVDPHGSLGGNEGQGGGNESQLPPMGDGNGVARKAARRRGNAEGEHQGGGLGKEGKDEMESSFAARRSGRKGISFLSVSMGDDEDQAEGGGAAAAEQATHEASGKSNGGKNAANGAGALDVGLSLSAKRKNKMMKMSVVTTDEPADADEGQVAGGARGGGEGGAGSIAGRFKRQYSLATRQSFRPQALQTPSSVGRHFWGRATVERRGDAGGGEDPHVHVPINLGVVKIGTEPGWGGSEGDGGGMEWKQVLRVWQGPNSAAGAGSGGDGPHNLMRYHLNWKVLASIGLGGDRMPVGLRRLLEDGGGLRVSKPTLITLSEIERREGGVPVSAVKYSFSYPHPDPHGHLEKTIKELGRTRGEETLPAWKNFVSWLQLGGFIFFDGVGNGNVVSVSCILHGPSQSTGARDSFKLARGKGGGNILFFGSALNMPEMACSELQAAGRWHELDDDSGVFSRFAWVQPAENFGNDSFFYGKDGGLAYLLKNGGKCALYFPIVHAQIQLVIEDLLKHGPLATTPKPEPGVPVLSSRGRSMTLEETYDSLATMQMGMPSKLAGEYVVESAVERLVGGRDGRPLWTTYKVYPYSKDSRGGRVRSEFREVYRVKVFWGSCADGRITESEAARLGAEARLIISIHSNGGMAAQRSFAMLHEYGACETDLGEAFFFRMQYFEGQTLYEAKMLCGSERTPGVRPQFLDVEVAQIGVDILEGLSHIHRHNFVHTDLCASNVMRVRSGSGFSHVILDVGLAVRWNPKSKPSFDGEEAAVEMFRDAHYISPELWVCREWGAEAIDCRSDLYSLGVLMFWLLTQNDAGEGAGGGGVDEDDDDDDGEGRAAGGRYPYIGTPSEIKKQVLDFNPGAEPPPVTMYVAEQHRAMLNTNLVDVVARAIQKGADTRYTDAMEMRDEVKDAAAEKSLEQYTIFLSYRVSTDSLVAQMLFDELNNAETSIKKQRVTVYLDKERLKTGENWEDGFCDGLKKSEIYMPLVSHGFLGPMCAGGDKKGLDPTPAGRRRLDPNNWPICYLPGIYGLMGHDAEDNCLKEVQLAQHLMCTPPDQKEGMHRLSMILPIVIGRQKEDGSFISPWIDVNPQGTNLFRAYSDNESVETKTAVQKFLLKIGSSSLRDYLASKGGDWGIRSSIKSLFDLQALFIDEKSCRLDGLKDDPMPLERQLAAARNSRQNRSQKGKSDSVSIDIFINIPVGTKEVSRKDEEVMAKNVQAAVLAVLEENKFVGLQKSVTAALKSNSRSSEPPTPRFSWPTQVLGSIVDLGVKLKIDDSVEQVSQSLQTWKLNTILADEGLPLAHPIDNTESHAASGDGFHRSRIWFQMSPEYFKEAFKKQENLMDDDAISGGRLHDVMGAALPEMRDWKKMRKFEKIEARPFKRSLWFRISARIEIVVSKENAGLVGGAVTDQALETALRGRGLAGCKVVKRGKLPDVKPEGDGGDINGLGEPGPMNEAQIRAMRRAVRNLKEQILKTIEEDHAKAAGESISGRDVFGAVHRGKLPWHKSRPVVWTCRAIIMGLVLILLFLGIIFMPMYYTGAWCGEEGNHWCTCNVGWSRGSILQSCAPCPANTFRNNTGAITCQPCGEGVSTGGRTAQVGCMPSCWEFEDSAGRKCQDYERDSTLCLAAEQYINDNGVDAKIACYACMLEASKGCNASALQVRSIDTSPLGSVSHVAASGGEGEQYFIFATDDVDHRVWRLTLPMMEAKLVCGSVAGFEDGPGSAAKLRGPSGIAVSGEWLYFADELNHAVRGVDLKSGEVSTIAGNGISGYGDGVGDLAIFRNPRGIAVGEAGGVAGGRLTIYVTESMNHCVRAIDVETRRVRTLAGLAGTPGFQNSPAGGGLAMFYSPDGIVYVPGSPGSIGSLVIADRENNLLRSLSLGTNKVTTLAGSRYGSVDGNGLSAMFQYPAALALGRGGRTIFVAETAVEGRIRQVEILTTDVTTVAGNPDIPPRATFSYPTGLATISSVGGGESVYVANHGKGTMKVVQVESESTAGERAAFVIIDVQDCFLDRGSLPVSGSLGIIPVINSLTDKACLFNLVVKTADFHPAGHISFASAHGVDPFYNAPSGLRLTCTRSSNGEMSEAACCPAYNTTSGSLACPDPKNGCPVRGPVSDRSRNQACSVCMVSPELCFDLYQTMWPDHCVQTGSDGKDGDWTFPPSLASFQDAALGLDEVVVRIGKYPYIDSYSALRDNTKQLKTELDDVLQTRGINTLYLAGLASDFCVSWTATDAIKMGYKVKLITDAIKGIYPGVPRNADDQEPESAVAELLAMLEAEGVELITSQDILNMKCENKSALDVAATVDVSTSGAAGVSIGGGRWRPGMWMCAALGLAAAWFSEMATCS